MYDVFYLETHESITFDELGVYICRQVEYKKKTKLIGWERRPQGAYRKVIEENMITIGCFLVEVG
jgi:hypothetical protein